MATPTSDSGRDPNFLKKRRKISGSRNRAQESKRSQGYKGGRHTVGGAKPQPRSTKVTRSNRPSRSTSIVKSPKGELVSTRKPTPKKPQLPKISQQAYNKRRAFKRLTELDKVRIENATTRHLNEEFNKNSKKLQRDIDRADTKYRKQSKQIKTVQQKASRAINRLNKAQWKVKRAQRAGNTRGSLLGAVAYAASDKYLKPQAEKAGKWLGKQIKKRIKPGTVNPKNKAYVMGKNGNWVKRKGGYATK
jgi:hypothetical protein